MRLPRHLLPHRATVEPYQGETAYGPSYGAPTTVRCLIEYTRRVTTDDEGREVHSEATVYTRLGEHVPPESRITVDGRTTYAETVRRRDGGGLPTPDHLEITLR